MTDDALLVALLPTEQKVLSLIEGSLGVMGYDVVRVRLSGGEKAKTLQIMIDRKDGDNVTVDDCEAASVQASAVLDVHEPIGERYRLEMSSPGIDRPLTRKKDFIRHAGFLVSLETKRQIAERKRFKGVLAAADEQGVVLRLEPDKRRPEGSDVQIGYADLAGAKLVLTDELLSAPSGKR
jgi:ribosome maturation factor RimP